MEASSSTAHAGLSWDEEATSSSQVSKGVQSDGIEGVQDGPARLRFANDTRLAEVCEPVRSSCDGLIRWAERRNQVALFAQDLLFAGP